MNKEEMVKDLNSFSLQKIKIEGAIEYIVNKLKKIEKEEKSKIEKSKREESLIEAEIVEK